MQRFTWDQENQILDEIPYQFDFNSAHTIIEREYMAAPEAMRALVRISKEGTERKKREDEYAFYSSPEFMDWLVNFDDKHWKKRRKKERAKGRSSESSLSNRCTHPIDRSLLEEYNKYFSVLGAFVLEGNDEVVQFLYENAWTNLPPLLRVIRELQMELTTVEFEQDEEGRFSSEFLYWWAMICIGEVSPLISRDLGTAKICLEKIVGEIPQASARLAYIRLLQSTKPANSPENVADIDILRQWACKHDLFSMIALARICFDSLLDENDGKITTLPARTMTFLQHACWSGHPVAIRLWNDILEFVNTPEALERRVDATNKNMFPLLDLKMNANMQIGP